MVALQDRQIQNRNNKIVNNKVQDFTLLMKENSKNSITQSKSYKFKEPKTLIKYKNSFKKFMVLKPILRRLKTLLNNQISIPQSEIH